MFILHAGTKLIPGFDPRSGHAEDLKHGTCGSCSALMGGWVQGNGSRAMLPLTRHQCSIYAKASRDQHRPLVALQKWVENRFQKNRSTWQAMWTRASERGSWTPQES